MSDRQTEYIDGIIEQDKRLFPVAKRIYDGFYMLCKCFETGGKAIICGNGGSASDAEHITSELMKGFLLERTVSYGDGFERNLQRGLPAISLVSQASLITAIANDISYDMIFAQQVYVYGNAGDVLIAISTSGNSQSVVNAAKAARLKGVGVLAFTGKMGGALREHCDILINAPFDKTHEAQEAHVKIYHAICADLEEYFFGG